MFVTTSRPPKELLGGLVGRTLAADCRGITLVEAQPTPLQVALGHTEDFEDTVARVSVNDAFAVARGLRRLPNLRVTVLDSKTVDVRLLKEDGPLRDRVKALMPIVYTGFAAVKAAALETDVIGREGLWLCCRSAAALQLPFVTSVLPLDTRDALDYYGIIAAEDVLARSMAEAVADSAVQPGHLQLIAQSATTTLPLFGFTRGRLKGTETSTYARSQLQVDAMLGMGCDDPLAQYMGASVGDVLVVQKPGQSANCAQRRIVITGHAEK